MPPATAVAKKPTYEELQQQLDAMKAKAAQASKITFKVSDKTGALSVYGLNSRFPVTLYKSQWERLIGHMDELKAFIAANAATLKTKE